MRPSFLPLLAAGALASALAVGQDRPKSAAPQVPSFGVETRLMALPVFVTDRNGKAVSGLGAADFEVEDGGKKATIVAFDAIDAGAPSAELPALAASRTLQAATRRQFLLLFDMAFSTPSGLNKAREAALEFLAQGLAPRDLAAVAVLGPGGPNVLVGFTSDIAQLRQAVARLEMSPGQRLRDPLGLAYDLAMPVQEAQGGVAFLEPKRGDSENRDTFLLLQRTEQEAYRRNVAGYVGNLEALAKLLDSVQGRKQVVLFSAGFDQSVLSGSRGAERQEVSQAVAEGRLWDVDSSSYFGDSSARGGLDQLFRRLGASDAIVHTVDIGGLAVGADVSEATRTQVGQGRDSLALIASGSGGMFLKEVNDVAGALKDVLDASRYFYVLGVVPSDEGKPGRFRKLSVKVKRPGTKASHRVGYVVEDPKAPPSASAARLTAGDVIAKGLSGGAFAMEALAVPLPPPSGESNRGESLLPVVLHVDGAGLLSGVQQDQLALEVFGYALDANGRILDALSATPALDLAKVRSALTDHGLQVLTVFRAPSGAADLRFLVRHPASGRSSSLRVLVPKAEAQPWPASAPLLMTDPATRLVVPVASRANPELDLPFRVGARPFSPEVGPVLKTGVASQVCVLARPPRGPSLEVMADLVAADGKTTALETTGPVRMAKDKDGAFRIVMNLTPSGIAAGDYALRVTLRDEAGEEVRSEQPVAVR